LQNKSNLNYTAHFLNIEKKQKNNRKIILFCRYWPNLLFVERVKTFAVIWCILESFNTGKMK